MEKRILLALMCCVMVLNVMAQEVKGRIMDAGTGDPLDFVNVALYNQKNNNKLEAGITSDLEGNFLLNNIKTGTYELKISYVGYNEIIIPIILTHQKPSINLGTIKLQEDSKILKEVQITGQKSQMKFEVDKKVFNVDQNIASAGASASDALSNIPSVSVDNEGNVSLRNNSSVTIWINGRPSGLSEENRAQILEQLPAESIQSIEIITNPSSKYSAEGSAGIINIIMKREKKAGYYGGVSGNADTFGGYGANANINYSYDKFEGSLTLGYRKREMRNHADKERTTFGEDFESNLLTHEKGKMFGDGVTGRLNLNYYISEKDILSFTGSGMIGERNHKKNINYGVFNNSIFQYDYFRDTRSNGDHRNFDLALDYEHKFSKTSDLKLNASYNKYKYDGKSEYNQLRNEIEDYQYQKSPREHNNIEYQADYTNAIIDELKIEAGYNGKINSRHSSSQTWINKEHTLEEKSLYNVFDYDESIQSGYLNLSGKYGAFGYQGGLRGEYTHYKTSSLGFETGEPEKNTKNYFNLFPSVFLTYAMDETNEFQINYTRRINRPRGHQLSAFKNISDSTNISFGNPLLLPEYTNSVEFNYIKSWEEHSLSTSLYYRSTDGVIRNVSYIEGNNMFSTYDNVTKTSRSGAELIAKNRLFEIVDLTTSVNLYYFHMDGFDYNYNQFTQHYNGSDNFSWDARVIANVILPWSLTLQMTGGYNSGSKNAQGKDYDSYWFDAGLRRAFLKRKLTVSVTGRDLLASRRRKTYSFGNNFEQYSTNVWGGRMASISIAYNFGNAGKKNNNGKKQGEDRSEADMMEF